SDLLLDTSGTLRKIFDFSPTMEFTIEVNPCTVTPERLALWKEVGINRLSIGVQSLKDQVLQNLNRQQSANQVFYAIEQASGMFENISVDLIIGLPDVSASDWKALLNTMVALPLMHMSVYFLTIHEDTALYYKVKKQQVTLPCDDTIIDLYHWSIEFLAQHGFVQYEVSNFARPGYQSRHNKVYWERKPYKAFGLGACSFDGSARLQNEKNLTAYLNAIEQEQSVTTYYEQLTHKQIYIERVMLGIRQSQGVLVGELLDDLSADDQIKVKEQIASLIDHGFITQQHDHIKLTPLGLSVENTIALRLML
ncbi:MAG TPA: coproporphyrinogen-III oxidase family protein, partial [Candidatus Babeliales bacterium]|nr:coproporphyrinogen-III oxidase family protein [Candidatus Babeliales bacterium]